VAVRIDPTKQPDPDYEDRSDEEHERNWWRLYLGQEGGRAIPDWAEGVEREIAEEVQAELGADGKRAYVESQHPRDPGGEGGGQWIKKGTTAADEGLEVAKTDDEFVSPGKEPTASVSATAAERVSESSVNPVWKMTIDGREWNVKNEAGLLADRLREDIKPLRDTQRELAAQEIYQVMSGLDPEGVGAIGFPEYHRWEVTVPGDVLEPGDAPNRGRPYKAGVAEWLEGEPVGGLDADVDTYFPGQTQYARGWLSQKIPDEQLRSLVLFDQVIGNSDRHGGNALWDDNRKRLVAIDHGLTFPSKPSAGSTYWNGPTMWAEARARVKVPEYDALKSGPINWDVVGAKEKALTEHEVSVLQKMQNDWDIGLSARLKPHLTKAEIKAVKARIDYMVDNRSFISSDSAIPGDE
jgi:hypothetical protein